MSEIDKPSDNDRVLNFREFVDKVYPRYQWYRHCQVLANVLQRVANGDLRRVMVFMPPRHGKSVLVSKLFPGYLLYRYPEKWVGLNSYAAELSYTFSRAARNAYVDVGGVMRSDAAAVKNWETPQGGGCWAAGVGGPITGKGFGSSGIIDDPIKNAKEALSITIKSGHQDWYGSTFYTRAEPDAPILMVATRWAEDDLPGWILRQESEDEPEHWHIVNFEAIKEDFPQAFPATCTVEPDWRSPGEALCPERFDIAKLNRLRKRLGEYFFQALYQQRPAPLEGGLFKRSWWKYYKVAPSDFDMVIQSWDCAFKETKTSDYVVGQVWGKRGGQFYLLDQVRDRTDINGTLQAIRMLSAKWPNASAKLVEDKANGSAVIDLLKREIPGLIPIEPEGGKLVRAIAIAPYVEAGNVFLPDPAIAPWIGDYVQEFSTFPNGSNDDQCFVAGTRIATLFGDRPIEKVKSGDLVITHLGVRRVLWSTKTGTKQVVEKAGIIGTPSHPVFTWDKNFVKMDRVTQSSKLSKIHICELIRHHLLRSLSSMVSPIDSWAANGNIIFLSQTLIKEGRVQKGCMLLYGSFIAARQYRKAGLFTIKMAIHLIMIFLILSVYRVSNIVRSIHTKILKSKSNICEILGSLLKIGINRQKVGSGIDNTQRRSPLRFDPKKSLVFFVGRFLCQKEQPLNTVAINVDTDTENPLGFTESRENALNAENFSLLTCQSTQHKSLRLVADPVLQKESESREVYNLEVEKAHTYYANGILVHNCDATSQAINWLSSKISMWAISHDNYWGG